MGTSRLDDDFYQSCGEVLPYHICLAMEALAKAIGSKQPTKQTPNIEKRLIELSQLLEDGYASEETG